MKTFALILLAAVACAQKPAPRARMKIVGKVTECWVEDVSKKAGKRVPVSHLSVAVERTEPADAKASLKPVEEFRASLPSPYAELSLAEGTRVEVETSGAGDILALTPLK